MKRLLAPVALGVLSFSLVFAACQDETTTTDEDDNGQGATGASVGGNGGNGGGNGGNANVEICDNGVDDNGDDFADCDDFDCCEESHCLMSDACTEPTENTNAACADNMDNDFDMLTDCADPSCHGHPDVTVCVEICTTDGVADVGDEDEDGFADCDDKDCYDTAYCLSLGTHEEAGVAECTDDADNDGDGFFDCSDFSCQDTVPACNEAIDATDNSLCIDGLDNNQWDDVSNTDHGRFVDCDAGSSGGEFQCFDWGHCSAMVESTDAQCDDGIDNDGDGFTDCDDFSCQTSKVQTVCDGNAITCADGINDLNNTNSFIDCADFACRCCPGEGDNCGTTAKVVSTCAPCTM